MDDYKPNSNRFKEEQKKLAEKKIEKVVTGQARVRKKSTFSKLADEFISEDAKNIKSYVFGEVLIPAIKKAISDIVTDGIDMILYGGSRGKTKRSTADRVSYRNYYDEPRSRSDKSYSDSRLSFDEVEVDSRGEAQEILSRMEEIIEQYQVVSVADLYELAGIRTDNYMVHKYGWTSIRNADIIRIRDGYLIKMPKAMPIN